MSDLIGFIGLGKMGSAMSACILQSGRQVVGWEVRQHAIDAFAAAGGTVATSLAEVGEAPVVFSMLWDDATTDSVVVSRSGLLNTLAPGSIHVAMGTLSPECSQRLQDLHSGRGQRYLAAPVFGRPEAAAQGTLNIMCAGERETYDRVEKILATMGTTIWIGSAPGQANLMKVAGNNMIFAAIQLLGEMFALLQKAGIAQEHAQAVIVDRLFPGPIFTGYTHRIRDRQWSPPGGDFGLARKDNDICLRTAQSLGLQMPLVNCMAGRIECAIQAGDGELDISAFAKRVFEEAGLDAI